MEKEPLIVIIVIRIIAFPFFAGLGIIGHLTRLIGEFISFFKYGSETIVYTRMKSRTTIQDVFERLQQIQEKEK